MLVYGRYVEVVAPPLVALGLVAVAHARGRAGATPLIAIVLAASVAVAAMRAGLHAPGSPSFWNVMSLPVRTDALGAPSLLAAGVVACAAAALLLWVAGRRPQALAPLALLMFLPTTAFAERELLQRSEAVYPSGWASIDDVVARHGIRRIAYDERHAIFDGEHIYPWFANDAVIVNSTRRLPAGRFIISSDGWSREHPTLGATAVWRDPIRDQTLWQVAPPRHAARTIQRCLQAAGLATAGAGESPRGAAALTLAPRAPRPGRVVVFRSESAASAYEGEVRRLVHAVGQADDTAVLRRANVLVVDPGGLPARRGPLLRCL
jgi:hypothetical protein